MVKCIQDFAEGIDEADIVAFIFIEVEANEKVLGEGELYVKCLLGVGRFADAEEAAGRDIGAWRKTYRVIAGHQQVATDIHGLAAGIAQFYQVEVVRKVIARGESGNEYSLGREGRGDQDQGYGKEPPHG